jgi:hypothetical protein
MATIEDKVIYRIQTADLANLDEKQCGAETTTDSDLGYKMYGYKDASGTVQRFLAKDQNIKVQNIVTTTGALDDTSGDLIIGDGSTSFVNIKTTSRKFGVGISDASDLLEVVSETDDKISFNVGPTTAASVGKIYTIAQQVQLSADGGYTLILATGGKFFIGTGWITVIGASSSGTETLATVAYDSSGVFVVPVTGSVGLGTAKDTADKVNFYVEAVDGEWALHLQNKSGSSTTPYAVVVGFKLEYHESIAAV